MSGNQERGGLMQWVFEGLIRSPQEIEALILELNQLNKNLEALRELQPQLEELTEVLQDLRKMAASPLGWRVIDPQEEEKPSSVA